MNRFRRLCNLAGRYDNPISSRFLAPVERKKERKKEFFIYPFHAINIRRYDSSMYIIHTVEYLVHLRGKVYRYSTSWRGVRAPNQRICVLVAMLGIFLAEREGRPGITKGYVIYDFSTGLGPPLALLSITEP
jgi:hypothetical protein